MLGQKGYARHDFPCKEENKVLGNYFTIVVFGEEHNDRRVKRDFLWQSYVSQGQSDELVLLENTNSSAFMTFTFFCFKGILQIQVGGGGKMSTKTLLEDLLW